VEKSLDQFFRNPQEKAGLHVAVSQLGQMRGVLSVLGLDQAVQTVARMRNTVDQILDTEVDEAMAREAGTFQQLGNNLSAMSFLVDMLNYQPALAKKLFVFDEEKGELLPLMGRTVGANNLHQPAIEEAQAISDGVQRVVDGVQGGLSLVDLSEQLGSLADQASLAEQSGVARAAREAAEAVVNDDAAAGAQALVGLTESSSPARMAEPEATRDEDNDEDDLLDIFLEEAREVVGNGLEAVSHLQVQPSDLEHLTTLRRAFHTLKGSSRMVGLDEFGEAAWAMEQLLNTVLAEQRPASPPLLTLAGEAMNAFSRWVDDISARRADGWRSQPFRASAEALRDQGQYLPVAQPVPQAAEMAPSVVRDATPFEPAPEAVVPVAAVAEPNFDLNLDAVMEAAPATEPLFADIDFGSLAAFSSSAQASAEPMPLTEVVQPEPVETPAIEPVSEVVEAVEAVAAEAVPEAPAETDFTSEADHQMPDEQTRVIGPLRIGIKLYNVYLNEADEWSRRLSTVLAEWALERHEPVPEQAEALAHSLAGSSATVGFQSLSDIARALEHAIESVGLHQRSGAPATAQKAQ